LSRDATAPLVIRDACPEDRPVIAEFNRRLALETEGKSLDPVTLDRGVACALADPDRIRYWVVALDGANELAGQAAVTREWSDWRNGWIWWLQSAYVAQPHRRRGIFRALYQHIRDRARADPDVIGLRLYVENSNEAAQRTYQSLGMKPGRYSVFEEIWPDRLGGLARGEGATGDGDFRE
jgi:GNAT superfamily N-acetyltransferase